MANLNKVMLIGRLTRDPEVRVFSNGGKVAKLGFAVNNRRKNAATGQWEDEPVFLDLEVFNRGETGQQADRVEQTLRKGQQVFVEGHLRMDTWEKDGQKRSRLVIVVDNFQYLEPRTDGGGMGGAPRQAPATRPAAPPASAPASRRPPVGGYAEESAGYDESEPAEAPEAEGGDEQIPF
jgi:single-strand DNA-binding protein